MALSNELQQIVLQLEAKDQAGTQESIERQLRDAGLDPATATLDQFNDVAQQAVEQPAEPIVPQIVGPDRDTAVEFSVDQAQKLLGSGVQTFGDLIGSDFLTNYGAQVVAQQELDIQRGGYQSRYTKSFAETISEDGVAASLGWISEKISENLVSSAAVIAGTGAAAAAAPVSAALATVIGGATLVGGTTLGIGEVRQELEDKGVYDKDDAATAVGAGIIIGLLDRIGAGKVLNKGGIVRAINKPEAIKGLFEQGVVKQVGKAFIAEGVTESSQELAVMGAAAMEGAEYTTPEVVNRLIDAGVVGGAMGIGSSTAQSAVQTGRNVRERLTNGNETKTSEETAAEEERKSEEEQADKTQAEVEAKPDRPEREPEVFGNKKGYKSQANAERFGVKKANGKPFNIVETDDGNFIVQERIEEETVQVTDKKTIPTFASKAVEVENNPDLGNRAFEVYERSLAGRTRVGDRLVNVADSVINFLEHTGLARNTLQPEIRERVNQLNELTAQLPDDPSVKSDIETLKSEIVALRDAGSSEFAKKTRRYLNVNVGANYGDAIKDAQLDRASGRAASDDAARRAMLVYREAVKDDVQSVPRSERATREKAYDDLLQRIIVDSDADVRFKLKDKDAGLHEDNIQETEDGSLVYTINGVEHNAPAIMKEPLIELIKINARERDYLSNTYFPRQFDKLSKQFEETKEAVVERETELNTIIEEAGGTDTLAYAAFEESTGQDWVRKVLQRDEGTDDAEALITQSLLLDGLNEWIGKNPVATMEKFIEGVTESNNIQEFHSNTDGAFAREDGSTPLAVAAALGGFENTPGLNALMRTLTAERKAGEMMVQHLNFIEQFENNPFHVSRSYKAYEGDVHEFLRSRRDPRTKEDKKIVSDYRKFVQERLATAYGLEADDAVIIAAAQRHIDKKLNEIDYTTPRSDKDYGIGPEAGRSYGGVLEKRRDVAPEERAFLGEVTDPAERIAHSLSRLARFRVNNEYANQIIETSLGTGLFQTKREAIEAGVSQPQRISIADPSNASKLQGMFATPELAYILDTIDQTGTYDAGVGGLISRLSGATKASLTLLDPAVSAANFFSGSGIVVENMPLLRDNMDIVLDEYSNAINRARGKGEKKIDLKAEIGIAGGSARAQDITQQVSISGDMVKRALQAVESVIPDGILPDDGTLNAPLSKAYSGWTGILMGMHKLGDEVPQKVIFRARERVAKNYYGMNDEQAAKYAADYARRTGIYAPYSPQAIKDLQKIPFIGGGFVGWYTGMLISVKEKASALAREFEMSADRYGRLNIPNYNSADAAMVSEAKRRFRNDLNAVKDSPVGPGMVGLAAGVFTPSVVSLGIAAVVGSLATAFGDEEEQLNLYDPEMSEMVGRLSPEYYRNIDRQIISMSDGGRSLEYINVTRLGNYGIFNEMLNELFTDDPDQSVSESVLRAMGTMTEPYLTPAFGAKNISEAITGKDEFGREIYKEDDTYLEKTAKASLHVAKNTVGNGFYREGSDILMSLISDEDFNEFNGTPIQLDDFILRTAGFKPVKFDAVKGLQQKSWEADRARRTEQANFVNKVFGFNKLSDSQVRGHLSKIQKRHDEYYKTLISKVEAARFFGLTDQEIAQALSVTGVSGYKPKTGEITGNMKLLLKGRIPAYKFPAGSAKNRLKKFEGRSIGTEARNNLDNNIRTVERLIGGG